MQNVKIKMLLQLFAEGGEPQDPPADPKAPQDPPQDPKAPFAVFPDKESFMARVNREARKQSKEAVGNLLKELGIENEDALKGIISAYNDAQAKNQTELDKVKEQLKKAYKGLWYKRMVEGLWVMADGIIYDNFNHDYVEQGGMVCIEKPPKILKYWIGVDYGNSNATVFLLLGLATDDKLYVLDEYYHSGKGDMGKSKSPSQYAEDFIKFLDREDHNGDPIHVLLDKIFIDPSAKGFILELYNKLPKQIRRKITTANNDVLFGIEVVTSLIGNDCVRVHKSCKQVLKELSSYCWNPSAQKVGEDKPIKENDHTLDALRYTTVGTRKIWEKILKIEYKNTRRS